MSFSDVSAATKFFSLANEGFNTTLSNTITAGATSVGLNSTTNLTNGSVFVGIIEPGTVSEQTFTGTVDVGGLQITNVVWTRGVNVGHAAGVAVVDYVTGTSNNLTTIGILKQHTQAGLHTSITNTGGLSTDTLAASGNATVGGTLGVTGATTLSGAVGGAGYDAKTLANSYKFSVYRAAAWTSSGGYPGTTATPFDTKIFDTGSNIDVVTNKGRFTAPVAGFYWFSAYGAVNLTSGTGYGINFMKNGAAITGGPVAVSSATTFDYSVAYSTILQLAANDYVEVNIYASAHAAEVGQNSNNFSGFLLSAT